ncbi:phospholipase D family protein [Ferrimonas gelatinilytica]|uniref:Phospholipase D family protein n=1 Tax=Ferrimonas gelatinilytica TaxID=1255257 RepID=A0ABP9RVJ3_9GAMM
MIANPLHRALSRTSALLLASLLLLAGCQSLPPRQATESYQLTDTTATTLAQQIDPLLLTHPRHSGFYLLNDGKDAFVARYSLIERAELSLDLQYYIWHDDLTGQTLHNRLLQAADRGVRVRLLLDDLDTTGKSEILRALDHHPNIEIRLFNPFTDRDGRAGDFVTDLSRVNHRMHNKTLTADNRASILGGRNIGDEYFNATETVAFGDADVIAIGPVVFDISVSFDQYWNSEHSWPLSDLAEQVSDSALATYRQRSEQALAQAQKTDYAEALKTSPLVAHQRLSDLDYVWSDWRLLVDKPAKIARDKVSPRTHLAPLLAQALTQTQSELVIVSPYFVPGKKLTERLSQLVSEGIRVRILTNSLAANDVPMVHAGYMRYRKALLEAGVELYEYKVMNENNDRREGRKLGASKASLHAKAFGVDRRYLFIGSFNLDARSALLNTEIGVIFESPEHARLLAEAFDRNLPALAYQVTLVDGRLRWRGQEDGEAVVYRHEPNTGWWQRAQARILSWFVPERML